MGRLFGTDGARGVAITELTCETAMNIGRAAAIVLTKHKPAGSKAKILIGKDTRVSSDILEAALISGIMSVGADAVLLGVVPTPAVAYLVKHENADAGVMISASHNSVEYNGIAQKRHRCGQNIRSERRGRHLHSTPCGMCRCRREKAARYGGLRERKLLRYGKKTVRQARC